LGKELTYTLIAGYNVKLRHHIIKRWQELESKANNPTATLAGLLEQNVKMIEGLHGHVIHLEHKIEQDKPMTDFGKAISESATAVKIGDWIKAIADDGFKVGRTTAFRWLRHHGFLMKDNQPYQQYINQGLFEVKEGLIVTSRGQKATFTTLLTGKGQMYFGKSLRIILRTMGQYK
jgi:phage antirepressor YoqD-like protein